VGVDESILWLSFAHHLVVEVDEHGEGDDPEDNEAGPVVVVDGVVGVPPQVSDGDLKKG
jgi:hypothetical protein